MKLEAPGYTGRAPIDAYGNGGFRFAGMSHRGSLLFLPSGIQPWAPEKPEMLKPEDFDSIFAEGAQIEVLLLGTGRSQVFPGVELRQAFAEASIGLEPMDTGAACRTYNVLLAERRLVAAALIAVD